MKEKLKKGSAQNFFERLIANIVFGIFFVGVSFALWLHQAYKKLSNI